MVKVSQAGQPPEEKKVTEIKLTPEQEDILNEIKKVEDEAQQMRKQLMTDATLLSKPRKVKSGTKK